MKLLMPSIRKSRTDSERNEEVSTNLGVEGVRERVGRSRLRWFNHVQRMGEGRTPKREGEMQPFEKRPRGCLGAQGRMGRGRIWKREV